MSTIDATAKGGNIAMAILLDFLNHSWEAKVSCSGGGEGDDDAVYLHKRANDSKIESGFNVRTQCFEIRTLTPYRKGEQVCIYLSKGEKNASNRDAPL